MMLFMKAKGNYVKLSGVWAIHVGLRSRSEISLYQVVSRIKNLK